MQLIKYCTGGGHTKKKHAGRHVTLLSVQIDVTQKCMGCQDELFRLIEYRKK